MPKDDEDEQFEERPRARPAREQNIQPVKPPSARPLDDDEDDARDRPRRRGPRDRGVRREDDGVSTIIPYRNGMALAGYYMGVFSLIPLVGAVLGPLALIFGIAGLRRVSRNPEVKGTGHAVTAIVLGSIGGLYNWAGVIMFALGIMARR